jgi:hypothetical protein
MITRPTRTEPQRLDSLQIRLSPDLLRRIDAYRAKLTMRPTRSMTIRFLLTNAMAILEEEEHHR